MCAMMTYGAYLPRDVSIPRVGHRRLADTGVALLAGLAIFPIVIALPRPGRRRPRPDLHLAAAGVRRPDGRRSSACCSSPAVDRRLDQLDLAAGAGDRLLVERTQAEAQARPRFMAGLVTWAIGLLSVLSLQPLVEVKIFGRDIMGAIEFIANDFMLPLGGLLIALFAGWALNRKILRDSCPRCPTAVHRLAAPGWTPATSSNFSMRLDERHAAITVSGRDKGRLTEDDIMAVDFDGQPVAPSTGRRPKPCCTPSCTGASRKSAACCTRIRTQPDGRLAAVRRAPATCRWPATSCSRPWPATAPTRWPRPAGAGQQPGHADLAAQVDALLDRPACGAT
jgi:hypothetical protein